MNRQQTQGKIETAAAWPSTSSAPELRSHRNPASRRGHRAAHAAQQDERRHWLVLGGLTIGTPFTIAVVIVELVR
jgi:hypothetical protein